MIGVVDLDRIVDKSTRTPIFRKAKLGLLIRRPFLYSKLFNLNYFSIGIENAFVASMSTTVKTVSTAR